MQLKPNEVESSNHSKKTGRHRKAKRVGTNLNTKKNEQ